MFEKEINFISDFSLNKVKKFGSFVTFEKVNTTDIHPAIKQYISAELDFLIFQDRNKLLHESSFDYSGQEVTKYFNLIGQEIKKSKRISFEDMRTLITQAVSFNINFLIRPKWSLSNLIFESAKEHTVQEVMMMMNYIYYYEYLRDILSEYLEKRKIIIINFTEFELILNKLDRELFSARANSLLENVLTSIAEFFNEGGMNKTKISPASIERFLKEKNLMDHLVTLRKSIATEDRQKYEIDDLKKILFVPHPSPEEKKLQEMEEHSHILSEIEDEGDNILAEIEDDEEQDKEHSSSETSLSTNSEQIDELKKVGDSDSEILETLKSSVNSETESEVDLLSFYEAEIKALDEDGLFKGIDDEPEIEKHIFEQNQSNNIEENNLKSEPISKPNSDPVPVQTDDSEGYEKIEFDEEIFTFQGDQQSELFDSDTDSKVKNKEIENVSSDPVLNQDTLTKEKVKTEKELFSFMSDKEMERIVGAVFNDDREDFVTTIEKISECKNYDEATEILKGVYFSYRVSPFSKEAVTLTNIVSSYFHQS